jgi:hypothetical protein
LQRYLDGTKFLSPTALDKYLTCSLQFYFKFVADLKEPEEIAEEVDQRIFGIIFHRCMENIYQPFKGKIVDQTTIQKLMEDPALIENIITDSFTKIYFKGQKDDPKIQFSGKNWLIFRILKKYIIRLLEIDKERAPFVIDGLELNVETDITLTDSRKIKIGGIIDRIDRLNGNLQILDYKTGKADLQFPVLNSLFDKENKTRNKAAFQTLVYSYIMHKSNPLEKVIKPGIFNLRGLFEENYDVCLRCKEYGNEQVEFVSIAEQFEEQLKVLLNEIFDPAVPFSKTVLEDNCSYCIYQQICQK